MIKKLLLGILSFLFVITVIAISFKNYHQNQNITKLLSENLDRRLIPHKLNSTNKLKNVLSDDLHSFEFDTLFNDTAQTPFFEVGHDDKETHGTSFEDYLEISKDKKIKKIWMDIKNVNDNNIPKILTRLNYLDKKYGIKNILLFETSSVSPLVRAISDAGYHTSYYLPGTILNNAAVQAEALRIKKQIKTQGLKAISFSINLYPAVKSHIEPIISKDIVYHTWGHFRLRKVDEITTIKKSNVYKDTRVKTIIYSYFNVKFNLLYSF